MNKIYSLYIFTTILLIINGISVSDAYAYLDPGTGSIVIQAIIGVLVGIGISVKIYWYKIKEKIIGINKKNK